jgi:type I restriction-modification system DNA methylase subunit
MAKKIDETVLAVLTRSTFDGDLMKLPDEQLDRKFYQEVAKVIEAAGGKWIRGRKGHVFDGDAAEAIEPVVLTGEITNRKQDFGQFDSPQEVVNTIITFADLKSGMKVLEPSCGIGAILEGIRQWNKIVRPDFEDVVHYFANELDPKRFEAVRSSFFPAGGITNEDFLAQKHTPIYDRVLMNPSFQKRSDVAHVRHALGFVKPGGRLVSVMSAGIKFRTDKNTTDLREFILENGAIHDLPDDSFKASGTSVKTVVVYIDVH